MVDKPLILRKLTELDEYLKQMGEFSSVTLEEYSRDWKVQRIVERTLQMMIEEGNRPLYFQLPNIRNK